MNVTSIRPGTAPIAEAGAPPTAAAWAAAFERALPYREFLERHGTADQRDRWEAVYARAALDDAQRALLATFVRRMPTLVLAGAWCGDCVNQCPIFARFAEASPAIDLRFLDRDSPTGDRGPPAGLRWPTRADRSPLQRGLHPRPRVRGPHALRVPRRRGDTTWCVMPDRSRRSCARRACGGLA